MKIKFEKGIAEANGNLGWAYYLRGDNVSAKVYINKALAIYNKNDNKTLTASPLTNLANVFLSESNYDSALALFTQAYHVYDNIGDKLKMAEELYNMGRIYNKEQQPAKARNYFQQAYNIHKKNGDELYMAQSLIGIANSYQFENKFDTSLLYYKQVLPIFIKLKDVYRTASTYENIGAAYGNKNDFEEALFNMLTAKKLYTQNNNKTDVAYTNFEIGDDYTKIKNFKNALEAYAEALTAAQNLNDKNLEYQVRQAMSESFAAVGDYKNAYFYSDNANKIKDSLFTKEKEDNLQKLQTQFESEKKEKENQTLKTNNLAASLQLQHNKEMLIGAGFCIVFLALVLYILNRNRKAKIKNIQLLKELNSQLEVQKNEIGRMNTTLKLKALHAQMNPHFIFNCMSSIQECMLTGRLDDANTYLSKLSKLLRMVLNHSDDENISLDKELEMLNLYLLLEKVRLKNSFNYSVEMDEEIITEELKVPTLILQPFAENAIWHGLLHKEGTRALSVKGKIENEMLVFSIEDNGIGRKKTAERKKLHPYKSKAIELISQRLTVLKQQTGVQQTGFVIKDLYAEDNLPAGTTVEITLPLLAS